MKKIKEYYEELYRCNEYDFDEDEDDFKKYFLFLNEKKFFDKILLDVYGLIIWREVKEILERMKLNDLLGFDGFILEFFNVFWKNFGDFVV